MTLNVNPLGPGAAEILNFDGTQPLAGDLCHALNQVFLEYPVLVFRNQNLSAVQLAAFGRYFGKLESYGGPLPAGGKPPTAALRQTTERQTPDQMLYLSPDDPDVLIMTNEIRTNEAPLAIIDNAETWHSDGSHKTEPYKAVLIHALRNPAFGGDTEFCDLRMLYQALDIKTKAILQNHSGIHHWSKSKNKLYRSTLDPVAQQEGDRIAAMIPEMRQPLVCAHPETGQPHLYLSPRFTLRIDGMPDEQSEALLTTLFDMMDDQRFVYRHVWREKDLMIWDNRCTNHRVCSYEVNDIRTRHRITVSGQPTIAFTSAT